MRSDIRRHALRDAVGFQFVRIAGMANARFRLDRLCTEETGDFLNAE